MRKAVDDAELETHPTLNDAVRARQGADFRSGSRPGVLPRVSTRGAQCSFNQGCLRGASDDATYEESSRAL